MRTVGESGMYAYPSVVVPPVFCPYWGIDLGVEYPDGVS